MKKYVCIKQFDQEDCGPACIASIAKYFGRDFTINRIRSLTGTGDLGTTLLGLKRGAELLGFEAISLKASASNIGKRIKFLPAIIHWNGNHFVVLFGKYKQKYVIADPNVGLRYLTWQELNNGWQTNMMLSLTPNLFNFYSQPDEKVGKIYHFFTNMFSFKHILVEIFLINVVVGILGLSNPLLIQFLIDDILIRGDTQELAQIMFAVLLMNTIASSGELIQSRLISWISQKIELNLMKEFARKILNFPLSYYEQRRSGEVVSRLDDIDNINQLVSQVVVGLPSQLFITLISITLMFIYSLKLTLLSLAVACIMTLTAIVSHPILENKIRKIMILDSENQGVLVEAFKGALFLKTNVAESDLMNDLQIRFNTLANLTLDTLKISITNSFFTDIVSFGGNICLLWYGSSLVVSEEMTIGKLLAFHAMNQYLVTFISSVIGLLDELIKAKTAVRRLSEIIETKSEKDNDILKSQIVLDPSDSIQCRNISFHYSGKQNIIKNLSVTIPGGKVTALIGESGCGKSTLVKLISKLYSLNLEGDHLHDYGYIKHGNTNLQDISHECLRKQIVLVPQDTFLLSRNILEIFKIGNQFLKDKDIFTACRLTGADRFISQLPNSYLTVLGEFGANLSGGQKQRLAIAIALVKDPPVLILDESTSALDYESEANVLANIFAYRRGKTTLLISHRIEVFSKADWIIKMANGQIEIQGTPQSVITLSKNNNYVNSKTNFHKKG